MLVSASFAVVFFLTRVVIFGLLVAHLVSQRQELALLLSPSLRLSYFGLLPALYGLNLWWFGKICSGIARVLQGRGDLPEEGKEQ